MNEERSKFYGKAVTNIWNNNPRYGIVRESKIENEWVYLRCTWIDDYLYEKDIERICELRNVERNDQWILRCKKRNIKVVEAFLCYPSAKWGS